FVYPGYAVHEELALMVRAGLTPAEALRAATTGGATFIGRKDDLGRIAPGHEADMLILRANPLADIAGTRAIDAVVSDGRIVPGPVSTPPTG
ncbi:MAG TPA: amidohydrolase family protein, partial [Allosphingosinicella sp.]